MDRKTVLVLALIALLIGGLFAAAERIELPSNPSPPENGLFPRGCK
jgi:hypothetical protein